MRIYTFWVLLVCIAIPGKETFSRSFRPVKFSQAMVVAPEPYAADIGADVLQKGGNAVDAAVAVGFALAVTYPQAGNIGGGGFIIYRDADNDVYALDYREKAPLKAGRNMYLDEEGNILENASLLGYLAGGVPGTVAGLWKIHRKFGKLEWSQLLQPAIELAEQGFIIDEYLAGALRAYAEDFARFPSSRKIFLKEGPDSLYKEGDRFIQKDLAATLKRIARQGADGFYKGKTALLFEQDMQKNGGLITREDLNRYEAVWRDPIEIDYRGYKVHSMPLPSSGGIVLAQILNGIEPYDLQALGHNSADHIRVFTEIARFAYADRARFLGDMDFVDVPVEKLISKPYTRKRIARINWFGAGDSDSLLSMDQLTGESPQTTHFSIVDRWGNAVSSTYTINGNFGSKVVIEGTGVLLNNEMDDFSVKPGVPNMFGLLGNEANAIEPEKRMLSSMTPSIVTRNDSLFMVIGSPGGSRIITTVAQVISNVIDFGMNIRQAIEAPRFHHQWQPDVIFLEDSGFSRDTENLLKIRGYKLQKMRTIGIANGLMRANHSNNWQGWADPRGNGKVNGY